MKVPGQTPTLRRLVILKQVVRYSDWTVQSMVRKTCLEFFLYSYLVIIFSDDSYQAILATNNQKLPLSTGEESFINVPITIADRNGVAGSNTGTSTVKVEVCR